MLSLAEGRYIADISLADIRQNMDIKNEFRIDCAQSCVLGWFWAARVPAMCTVGQRWRAQAARVRIGDALLDMAWYAV